MSAPASISIGEARRLIAENVHVGRVERVPLLDALGRVAAEDLVSDIDVTPFDDSAMDGFAVRSEDIAGASPEHPAVLRCIAHIGAGASYEGMLQPCCCVRIMTGAPVPAGADTVVKIEDVRFEGEGSTGDGISFVAPAAENRNIRKAGSEIRAGEVAIRAGETVSPAGVGLLASTGNLELPVFACPKVGIITIGSELVDASDVPGPGMIRDSNRWAIAAYVRDAGGVPVLYPRVVDDEELIAQAFRKAVRECDAVVSTGGACLGDFDLTPHVLERLGHVLFTRISMKPGKSQPFGIVDGKPVFVLSGNPGASSIGFEMFVRPALRLMQGYSGIDHPVVSARIDCDVRKKEPRVFLQRGILRKAASGGYEVSQYRNQSSALHGSFQRANCLIVIPEGLEGVRAGDAVDCILTKVDESAPI